MGRFASAGSRGQPDRALGQNFNKDEGVIRSTRSVIDDAQRVIDNAEPVTPPPTQELREARAYIETLNGLISSLTRIAQQLAGILKGQFTENVKSRAESLASGVASSIEKVKQEKTRTQSWINQHEGGPTPAPPIDPPSPIQKLL